MALLTTVEAFKKAPRLLLKNQISYTHDEVPLIADNLSFSQIKNLILSGTGMLLKSDKSRFLPPAIQIEPTNTCNLKCPLCPTGAGLIKRKKGFMPIDLFEKILSEISHALISVLLYGWGEPFLHKDLAQMIRKLSDRNINSIIPTNGQCPLSMDNALKLVDSGLTLLIIAMEGSSDDIYKSYRISGNFEKVKQFTETIETAKHKRASKYPITNIRLVASKYNEQNIPDVEKLSRDLGVNMFSLKSLGNLVNIKDYDSYNPQDQSLRRFNYKNSLRLRGDLFRCHYPFRQPTIFFDGTVVGCEFDFNLEAPWGKIGQDSFKEIFNCTNAQKLRRSICTGKNRPKFCALCPYQGRTKKSCVIYVKELKKGS